MKRKLGVAAGLSAVLMLAGVARAQPPLEALPEILQLQLSQRPAWRAYTDALAQTHADETNATAQVSRINAMTTPGRLDATRDQLRAEQQSFERQAVATAAFYAVLSPDQKQVFDDLTRTRPPPPPLPMPRRAPATANADTLRQPPPSASLPSPGQ